MKTHRNKSNRVLLVSLLIYAFVTLPYVQSAYILVFGLIAASVIRDQQEVALRMFGVLARFITHTKDRAVNMRSPSTVRELAIRACNYIDQYPEYMTSVLYRKRQLFFMLNNSQREAAKENYKRLLEIQRLADENAKFLNKIKQFAIEEFGISEYEIKGYNNGRSDPSSFGYETAELIEHFVRDWASSDYYNESRKQLFAPFWPHLKNRKKVLVPGSGLGRLAADIAAAGAEVVDAPELNASMWLSSKYAIASEQLLSDSDVVYPYLLHFSFWREGVDQLEGVPLTFSSKGESTNFEYANFLTYDNGYKYDAIATCFFIDTAQNVFSYIEKIASLLAPGGVWVNRGPLKWGTAPYVEFSVDELIAYLKSNGWKILELWDEGSNKYNGSPKSMLNSRYDLIGWAAQRQ